MSETTSETTAEATANTENTEDAEEILGFLTSEARIAERSVTLTAIFGLVAAALAVGYLGWMDRSFVRIVRPSTVADVATGTATEAIPRVASQLKEGLLNASPRLAGILTGAVIDAVPVQRQQLEASFLDLTADMAKASAHDVVERLRDILKKSPREGTPEEQMDRAVAMLVTTLDREVEAGPTGPRGLRAARDQGIFVSMRESSGYLRGVNARLAGLANNRSPNARDRSTRRLIGAWLQLVEPAPAAESSKP